MPSPEKRVSSTEVEENTALLEATRLVLTDARACPVCKADLARGEWVLADLDFDRWHSKAKMNCHACGAALVVQEIEVRIGLYGGGMYYQIEAE